MPKQDDEAKASHEANVERSRRSAGYAIGWQNSGFSDGGPIGSGETMEDVTSLPQRDAEDMARRNAVKAGAYEKTAPKKNNPNNPFVKK